MSGSDTGLFDTKLSAAPYFYTQRIPRLIIGLSDIALKCSFVEQVSKTIVALLREVLHDKTVDRIFSAQRKSMLKPFSSRYPNC